MPRSLQLLAAVAVGFASPLAAADPKSVCIRGATVYDGTGKPGFVADVVLRDGWIEAVGKADPGPDALIIDGAGLVVCPGFIDLHTHCDSGLQSSAGKENKNYVTQGCTTVVTGNCGSGPVDVAAYFAKLEKGGIGTNVIHLATHNNIRERVMGNANRRPTADEQAKMEELVDKAMADGAWGLSTGLIYNPGTYAKTEEIIGLAKAAGKHGGLYASHIRDEGGGLLTSIEEAIRIGAEGGCPVHVSHIKASGKSAWGTSARAVAVIAAARAKGQTVTADQYPYTASSTSLKATVVPTRYREGTSKEYVARLDDPKLRADLTRALASRDGGSAVRIARYSKNPKWQGKSVADIAKAEGKEPVDIVLEIEKNGGAQVVNFGMSEEDVRVFMKQPWVATASDGGVQTPGDTVPHPRSYGTFPRKVGRYAIEDGVIPLEQAVRSGTGLPADILKLADRGYLKPGMRADVVVFDPKAYRDTATYDKPHQYAAGVKWVFVNGRAVVADGKHQPDVLAGQVLRHSGR
ncbi:MAG: D-aminoacylase [Gemmataceae bacterium]